MNDAVAFNPDWLSSPGETISDILRDRGMSEQEFANASGISIADISQLLAGHQPISPELARRLAASMGASAAFWLARDDRYQSGLKRLAGEAKDDATLAWLRALPIKDMVRFGWIPETAAVPEQVAVCLRFF